MYPHRVRCLLILLDKRFFRIANVGGVQSIMPELKYQTLPK